MRLSLSRMLFLLFVAGRMVCLQAGDLADSRVQWRVYNGDRAGTKYSALSQINRRNVARLKPVWIFHTGDSSRHPPSTIECNPLVVNGVMYVVSPGLKVIALRAATGKKLWVYDPFAGKSAHGVSRGLTWWQHKGERRLFGTAGPYLFALDPATGRLISGFGEGGKVDLREGLDRDVYYLSVTATSPGIVYHDLLIMGSSVGEGPNPAAPGHIRAFDVRTGKRRWIFHTIPHPGETGYQTWPADAWKRVGGANAWGGLTLDAKRGLVFCGTGSAAYDHFGGDRPGKNLFANCVLALDAATGKLRWYFQAVHHDLWDYDLPCAPNLVTVERNGRRVDAVAQVGKVGHLFLLDRESGKPLFPVKERPVPRSQLPGESSWPTQPFPVRPPAYARQRFTTADVTDLNPAAHAAILHRLRGMRLGSIFLPPGLTPSVALPQFNGGTDWGGAAFDPKTHLLYVNASDEAEWISMRPVKTGGQVTLGQLGKDLYAAICSSCHGVTAGTKPGQAISPSLKGVKARLSMAQVRAILESGRGQMPSFASFSEIEKQAVLAFLFETNEDRRVDASRLTSGWFRRIPYIATGHHPFRDPHGFPANRRPWGTLTAINLDTGTIRWQSPLGTYPALEAEGLSPTGTFNMGGPLVTAGGLVFIGAAMDERFHAYDKRTGKLLWQFQMDAGGYATPATFEVGGRQFVVIAAGGGGKPETKPGDAFYCFALPERQ